MKLELKLKAGTTVAQAEELFEELTKNKFLKALVEDIKLTPGGTSLDYSDLSIEDLMDEVEE